MADASKGSFLLCWPANDLSSFCETQTIRYKQHQHPAVILPHGRRAKSTNQDTKPETLVRRFLHAKGLRSPFLSAANLIFPIMIDKLAWLLIQNKQILSTRSRGKDKYYIPGGKREAGETDAEALCREIKEELSVDLELASLQNVGSFEAQAHGHPDGTMVRMTCYTAGFTGTLQAATEIEEIKWLSFSDKDKISEVDIIIFDFLRGEGLL